MAALRELAATRNVRSILFRFSRATAANAFRSSDAPQILRALKIHGFRLGYIGEQWMSESRKRDGEIGSAFDFIQYDAEIDAATLYARAVESLNVPLQRTILATERGIKDNDASEFRKMATAVIDISADTQPAQQLTKFTKDLLSFDNCLDTSGRCFGPYRVRFSQIFCESPLSFALVNLKPIVPGHVLIVPKRCVDRFQQLDADEVADIWSTAQLVGKTLEKHFGASSLTFAIQDGEAAGQTVKHVHIHILPRAPADFTNNDDIYTEIEKHEQSLKVDNETRTPRSEDEMAFEASTLRKLFQTD